MSYVITYQGVAGRAVFSSNVRIGSYLKHADVDAFQGLGAAIWTPKLEEALRFASFEDAVETWRKRSTRRPIRKDGKPNRPLTAFSVEIIKI